MRAALVAMLLIGAAGVDAQFQRQPRSGGRQADKRGSASPSVTIAFDGTLKTIDKKRIVIENAEGNEVVLERAKSTVLLGADGKKLSKDPAAGALVAVDGRKGMTGILTAVQVRVR